MDTLLQRELSPVPLSIVTFDGSLRLASSKSDFVNITQKNVHQSQPPISHIRRALLPKVWKIPQVQSLSESGVIISLFVVSHFSDKCTRVDLVFDRHVPNSTKAVTRAKRKREKSNSIGRDVESREQ